MDAFFFYQEARYGIRQRAAAAERAYRIDRHMHPDHFAARPRLAAYRDALLARPSVVGSVVPEFTELYIEYFRGKGGYVAGHLPATPSATHQHANH